MSRLEGSADALGKVLASVPDVVVVVDLEGTILYLNRVEEGYDREQVLGMRSQDIMPPESQATFQGALDALARTGLPQAYELEATSPTGQPQRYRSRMVPRFEGQQVIGATIIATNITELRAAQAELEQLRRLLPMCSWCNNIQGEDGMWVSIESHLEREVGTRVSHGMCPDCFAKQVGGNGGGQGDVA